MYKKGSNQNALSQIDIVVVVIVVVVAVCFSLKKKGSELCSTDF